MRDLGWTDDGNVRMEVRFAAGSVANANDYAAELVGLAPDVLVANSSPAVAALQQRTRTIPIVFAQVVDPVSVGFVENLARPGGNITGFVSLDYAFGAKWLELLKEIAPRVSRVGVLRDPTTSGAAGQLGAVQGAASLLRVELTALDVREPAAIERNMALLAREPNGGLIVLANPTAAVHLNLIVALAGLPFMLQAPLGDCGGWRLFLLGTVQLGLPYVFYAAAIKHVTALEATLIPLLEPVLNPLWVMLALGERPGPWAIVGALLVVAMTIGVSFFAALRKNPRDASGLVKSMMTVSVFRVASGLSVIGIPRCPAADISPASLPNLALPGLSIAATRLKSGDC